jgi:hypothetical protein
MKYDIESKLNAMKTKPMTEAEKNTMWQKIEFKFKKETSFAESINVRLRAGVAFVLAVLFAGSGVAFAYADTAKPGDALFPLGVAREKVEIFLAPEANKNELRVKFAEKRIKDGQVFLNLLVRAKGTFAVSTSFASSAATSTASTGNAATSTATTTVSTATTTKTAATEEDAARRFKATIAYLEGVKAEMLKNGGAAAGAALQNAIDAMVAQARSIPSNDSSVLVKIKDNANKFKMDIRIANGATTTRIAWEEKNNEHGHGKKDDRNDEHNQNGTSTAIIKEIFISKFFHKEKNEDDRKNRDDNRGHGNKHEDDEHEHEGFFERLRGKITICHVSGGHKQIISIGKNAVRAHLAHGDSLGKCGDNGNATTTPDTTAPVISNIISRPTATISEVAWDTNESASYKFWYGATTTLALGTPDKTGGASVHQTISLSGLSSDTTYRFVIASADASGNTSTSTEQSFKTAVIPDTTAPVISSLSASAVTESGATISWNTDEITTGKVKYATTTPLSNVLEDTTLALTHSFHLAGLIASSTYRYMVSSTDGAGNATSSAELEFTTL